MAGRIIAEDVEALKARVSLADVVSDHTVLKRAGSRLKGLCPFHEERTASFTVDDAQGLYHCFGCQAGGDVYSFLQRVEGLEFAEAVEQLARRVGYQLRYEQLTAGQRRALGERSRLVAVNTAAAAFYHRLLLADEGAPARAYLASRGFDRDDVERFQLGFAPPAWDRLARHLVAEGFDERDVAAAGLAVPGTRGRLRDRFRARLVFPVADLGGDVIGFGGRLVPGVDDGDAAGPKYLNTPDTPVYRKHRILYGMSSARAEIVRRGEAVVVEGYTDVIALHRCGVANAVATCGTAVGEEHIRLLGRYAGRVVLAFDADPAGQRAAERAFEIARGHPLDVRVLLLPDGADPADVVADGGAEAVEALVASAEPVLRFMLRRRASGHDPSPEGKAAAVEAVAPLLAEVTDPVLAERYTRWVAQELVGVGDAVVVEAVRRAGLELPTEEVHRPGGGPPKETSGRVGLERDTLRVAVQRPELLPTVWAEVACDDFRHPRARAVFAALDRAGPGADLDAVLAACADDDVRGSLRALALEEFTVEPDQPHVAMLVASLLLDRVERDIATRKADLERLNPVTDPDAHRRGFEDLIALEARRRDLRELCAG